MYVKIKNCSIFSVVVWFDISKHSIKINCTVFSKKKLQKCCFERNNIYLALNIDLFLQSLNYRPFNFSSFLVILVNKWIRTQREGLTL